MIDFENLSYEEAREYRDELETLLKSAGWGFVVTFLAERAELRHKELISMTVQSVEQMAAFNYVQGGLAELVALPEMIGQVHMDLTEQITKIQDEMESEDGEGR